MPKNGNTAHGPLYYAFLRFLKNRLAVASLMVLSVIIILALFAPFVTPAHPYNQDFLQDVYSFPSKAHWFGVDANGRDYFTRIIYGARVSLTVGFAAALASLVIGIPIGSLGGYLGGVVDWFVMRLLEIFSVIPPLLLGILLGTVTGGSLTMIIFICTVAFWVRVCRLVRGQVKSLSNNEYITAAKAQGAGTARIIFRHVLPNTVAQILVGLALIVPRAMLLEAGLSFLGVGINPPIPSWGKMINGGLHYIYYYWHLALFPALFLAITILSTTLVADGLRDALDPSLKGKM